MADEPRPQNRDDATGRYDYDGNLHRLCRCGHTLGDHSAGTPHECFVPTMPPYTPCDCTRFRPVRVRKGRQE